MARKSTAKGKSKGKEKRQVAHGRAHIHASFNNTIISICDPDGNSLVWSSAGHVGFKGSRKGTPFAAQLSAEDAAKRAKEAHGMSSVDVYVSGPGQGRDTAIRSLSTAGMEIRMILDTTSIPHNGCRPPKKRRV